MRCELIATLGPSSAEAQTWRTCWQPICAAKQTTGFRLNTSHLVQDLQGSCAVYSTRRLGSFPAAELRAGQRLELVPASESGQPDRLPVPHPDLFLAVGDSSGEIVLNDGKARLQLESVSPHGLQARVTRGGPVAAGKGITFTQSGYRKEFLNEKDRAIVDLTSGMGSIRYALS